MAETGKAGDESGPAAPCLHVLACRYSQLWLRSGDHEVLVLRPTIPMTLLRWKGVVTAGKDIDKVRAPCCPCQGKK